MDTSELGGLDELAAVCTAEGGSMAVMTGLNEASHKRRRASQAGPSAQVSSIEEHLAALRSRWQARHLRGAFNSVQRARWLG